jgi:hypothetical protein
VKRALDGFIDGDTESCVVSRNIDENELSFLMPEHHLLIAILKSAVTALLNNDGNLMPYFTNESEDEFSFRWTCIHLSIDPDAFLHKLMIKYKSRDENYLS